MWNTAPAQNTSDLVCYIFHHWSGQSVDRSEIVTAHANCTPVPRQEFDENGLPSWYLFRSIPKRLCPRAGQCRNCSYALGDTAQREQLPHGHPRLSQAGFHLSP